MNFGLTACRKALPQVQRIAHYLEDGFDELELHIQDGAPLAGTPVAG